MNELYNKKILIVDDEADLLDMLENILRKEGFFRIYKSCDIKGANKILKETKLHCCILDIMLPDGDGFDLIQAIKKFSNIPVIFLTAKGEGDDRITGLKLGADDYIVKPFLSEELILRLLSVLKRVYILDTASAETSFILGNRTVNLETGTVSFNDMELTLTAKEYILLKKLHENKNKIVTNDSLCETAWGDDYFGYENTLMVHIRRIREKIEAEPSKPKHLLTLKGLGYKLVISDEQ